MGSDSFDDKPKRPGVSFGQRATERRLAALGLQSKQALQQSETGANRREYDTTGAMADVIQEAAIPAEFRAGFEQWGKHCEEYMRREWPDATFTGEYLKYQNRDKPEDVRYIKVYDAGSRDDRKYQVFYEVYQIPGLLPDRPPRMCAGFRPKVVSK